MEFIATFADHNHHGKEEDILFPAMEKAGFPRDGGPVGVMLMEHTQGREYVGAMRLAVARLKNGSPVAAENEFLAGTKGGLLEQRLPDFLGFRRAVQSQVRASKFPVARAFDAEGAVRRAEHGQVEIKIISEGINGRPIHFASSAGA